MLFKIEVIDQKAQNWSLLWILF